MNKAKYEAPTSEVVEVKMESGLLQGGSGNGSPSQSQRVDYESQEW